MSPIRFTIILLYITSCDSHVCEDNKKKNVQILDIHQWKQSRKSSNLLINDKKRSQNKTTHRNWLDADFINRSLGVKSKGIQFLAPTFILPSDGIRDERCKTDYDTYLKELSELKLWALKMYDSSGKLTSGILNGNVNQFGDFDQCLSVDNKIENIKGKYCLVYFQIKLNGRENEDIKEIFNLVHSHNAFRSDIRDPGHRIPKFSTINWALCIPSSCSHEEVEHQLKHLIQTNSNCLYFDVEVKVDEEMCHLKKSSQLPTSFIIVSTFLSCIIALALVSTVKDIIFNDSDTNLSLWMNLLHCFSLKRNLKQLTNSDRVPEDIHSIHGLRMINSILLLFSHKSMAMFFYPYTNRTYLIEKTTQSWTFAARIASLYTDSFIMISATLTAYSFSKILKKNGYLDIKNEYLNRLIRIFPLFTVTVLLSTFIIPELGSGPQWGLTVSHHSNTCKNSWWRNFLFIHNYFGFENMCLTHTHHLGIDTQLFFTSPFLIYVLHKWQLAGACFLISVAAISTGFRYRLTVEKNLSYFIYPGISLSQMLDTANYSYIIPYHRLTVYIIGIIFGYMLRNGKEYQIKNHTKRILWMIAFSLFYCIISKAMSMSNTGYVYNKHEAAHYSALTPIAWCLILGWIMFSSHINPEGVIGQILSSKLCIIWTRISYAVYLIQFPIIFFNVGRQRYPQEFTMLSLVNIYEYFTVITASVILTLFIDMPSNNIRKFFKHKLPVNAKKKVEKS